MILLTLHTRMWTIVSGITRHSLHSHTDRTTTRTGTRLLRSRAALTRNLKLEDRQRSASLHPISWIKATSLPHCIVRDSSAYFLRSLLILSTTAKSVITTITSALLPHPSPPSGAPSIHRNLPTFHGLRVQAHTQTTTPVAALTHFNPRLFPSSAVTSGPRLCSHSNRSLLRGAPAARRPPPATRTNISNPHAAGHEPVLSSCSCTRFSLGVASTKSGRLHS